MDSLEDLPVDEDTELDEEKEEELRKHVGAPAGSGKKSSGGFFDPTKWKIIGCMAVIFAILANPWSQSLYEKLPYVGESKLGIMGFMLTVFIIATILVVMLV